MMSPQTTSDDFDAPIVLLNADVWEARMRALGYTTVKAQAAQVGCARSALSDLINGKAEPRRSLGRRMVRVAKLPPSKLFKLAAA